MSRRRYSYTSQNLNTKSCNSEICPSVLLCNCRVVGVEGDLWKSASRTYPKAGVPRAGSTGSHAGVFWSPLEKETQQPLWSVCSSVQTTSKKFFLIFKWNVPCFSLCLLPFVLLLSSNEESLAPSLWCLPLRYLYASIRCSLSSFLQSKQAQLSELFFIREVLQSPNLLCSPPLQFVCFSSLASGFTSLQADLNECHCT